GTLARPEAALEVTREMVDLERNLVALNPPGHKQTKKYRPTVPLVPELRPWIENAPPGILVRYKDRQIDSFKTAWRAIRKRAGLAQEVVPKTIRHTMATELRKHGVPEADIQGFLGHRAYGGRTEVYAKYRPEYLGLAAGVVNDYMKRLRESFAESPQALP
ncbi:MAG: tyrosine-type recombinase/integrase, partial [Xanthomonadaceae bacterium]|nr:tyrosine-type recombinase/integrase [Xanthomonadaceae bacterium]